MTKADAEKLYLLSQNSNNVIFLDVKEEYNFNDHVGWDNITINVVKVDGEEHFIGISDCAGCIFYLVPENENDLDLQLEDFIIASKINPSEVIPLRST